MEDKSAQTKSQPKMVPVGDLIAYKKSSQEREKKLREELAETKGKLASQEEEINILKTDLNDDDEVKRVKLLLLEDNKKLKGERAKLNSDLTGFKEREKLVRAKELFAELKGKGVEFKESDLMDAEDMEAKATDLYVEHLAKENDELKHKEPGSLYESETPTVVKKDYASMPTAEFMKEYESKKREALSRR